MPRSRAEHRHHRHRVIANRLRLIRDCFRGGWGLTRGPGSLSKDHFSNCSCFFCKPHKHLPKRRFAQRLTTVAPGALLHARLPVDEAYESTEPLRPPRS